MKNISDIFTINHLFHAPRLIIYYKLCLKYSYFKLRFSLCLFHIIERKGVKTMKNMHNTNSFIVIITIKMYIVLVHTTDYKYISS